MNNNVLLHFLAVCGFGAVMYLLGRMVGISRGRDALSAEYTAERKRRDEA